mmetsp:Transcript_62765/g.127894  ORF Transcript_62765/g.127894 Transcript_62765/m.127894 type:complete len:255 (-) Transcript_62765:706-1470(-)
MLVQARKPFVQLAAVLRCNRHAQRSDEAPDAATIEFFRVATGRLWLSHTGCRRLHLPLLLDTISEDVPKLFHLHVVKLELQPQRCHPLLLQLLELGAECPAQADEDPESDVLGAGRRDVRNARLQGQFAGLIDLLHKICLLLFGLGFPLVLLQDLLKLLNVNVAARVLVKLIELLLELRDFLVCEAAFLPLLRHIGIAARVHDGDETIKVVALAWGIGSCMFGHRSVLCGCRVLPLLAQKLLHRAALLGMICMA